MVALSDASAAPAGVPVSYAYALNSAGITRKMMRKRAVKLQTSDFLSKVGKGKIMKHATRVPEARRFTYRRDPDPTKKVRVTKLIWWVLPSRVINEVHSDDSEARLKALKARLER